MKCTNTNRGFAATNRHTTITCSLNYQSSTALVIRTYYSPLDILVKNLLLYCAVWKWKNNLGIYVKWLNLVRKTQIKLH